MSVGPPPDPEENMVELLGPREVIGQAIGVLMTEHEVSRDAAFELLVQGSASSHQRVRSVAEQIVRQSRRSD